MEIILHLIALLAGAAIGLLWARRNPPQADGAVVQELRGRLADQETQAERLRVEAAKAQAEAARLEEAAAAAKRSEMDLRLRHEADLADRKVAMAGEIAALKESFAVLSAEALRQAQPELLAKVKQVVETLEAEHQGDLKQRQEAIKGLVGPLQDQLGAYAKQLQVAEQSQNQAIGEVKAQLQALSQSSAVLSQETEKFRAVLTNNQARGSWGEEKLRRLVEVSGMSPHCDFTEQEKEGDVRPDMVVRLPGERCVAVDSKVPDIAFINDLEKVDEAKRRELLQLHSQSVRDRVKELSKRNYPANLQGSLDYAVLFLPSESLFSLALEADRDLLVWAASEKVLVATPASLIGLLRGIHVCWLQFNNIRNAELINAQAQELFERIQVFVNHVGKVGEHLDKASKAYNSAIGSYTSRVLPSGRRYTELKGLDAAAGLPEPEELATEVRHLGN